MIIWRGHGIWTFAILLGGAYLFPNAWFWLHGSTWAQSTGPGHSLSPIAFGIILSGAIVVAWGYYIHRHPPRPVVEVTSGRTVMQAAVHSVYGVRAQYWGMVFMVLGLLLLMFKRTAA